MLPEYGGRGHDGTCCVVDHYPGGVTHRCTRQSTWHIAWERSAEQAVNTSFACDRHMELVRENYAYFDRHPIGVDCTGPRREWVDSRVGAWCRAPDAEPTA